MRSWPVQPNAVLDMPTTVAPFSSSDGDSASATLRLSPGTVKPAMGRASTVILCMAVSVAPASSVTVNETSKVPGAA